MSGEILFYSVTGEHGYMSNFSRHPVKVDGKIYPTSEHYFQSQKFAGTKYESEVRRAKGPGEAAQIGRDRSLPLRRDWESVKDNVMRKVVEAKFRQHEDIRDRLFATDNAKLVEDTTDDTYWGRGSGGRGKNMLGVILMEVRSKLRAEKSHV